MTRADLNQPTATPPSPFDFSLTDAGEVWTRDPDAIAALSDEAIVDGLLRVAEVCAIVGAAKTAKTWTTLKLALCIAAGTEFLELPTHPRKVLYLDYELKPGTFAKRLSMVADERPDQFFFQCLRGEPKLPSVADVERLVIEHGFGVVVVDSLYRTGWLSEENNNDTTSRELAVLQALTRRTRCTLIVVDHTAKGGGSERSAVDAARGASAKGGFFDGLFVLRSTDKGPDSQGTYAILDPVLRDWPGFKQLPLLSFTWTATTFDLAKIDDVEAGEASTAPAQILDVLAAAEAPIGRRVIAEAVSMPDTTIRRALEKLMRQRRVVESADPTHKQRLVYRLADLGDEPRQTSPNVAA